MIVGGAVPAGAPLTLDQVAEAGTASILDRREMVVVNIGGDGTVAAAGDDHAMVKGDMLYLGMGSGPVTFAGAGRFYILSAPAHATHPTRLIRIAEAATVTARLGGDLERAHDLPVRPPRRDDGLPARRRPDPARARLGLEHHARARPRPPDGGLSLHRPRPRPPASST